LLIFEKDYQFQKGGSDAKKIAFDDSACFFSDRFGVRGCQCARRRRRVAGRCYHARRF
jgi:hypothetical protein